MAVTWLVEWEVGPGRVEDFMARVSQYVPFGERFGLQNQRAYADIGSLTTFYFVAEADSIAAWGAAMDAAATDEEFVAWMAANTTADADHPPAHLVASTVLNQVPVA